ncbi:hypothetical protein BD311DRAFT_357027 [Dichomitus squalens]|uniref:Uncharacterized protein n=1 Tax=Dichomitus squalens TaxID=114155 RepID=A0A4Q9MLN7_9APHY|nr:hypothetical protein BD311DRAFT_357027 [Dichomitus squalens]
MIPCTICRNRIHRVQRTDKLQSFVTIASRASAMSPLPLHHRYLSSEASVFTTLLPTGVLARGSRHSDTEPTTTVVVTITATQQSTLPGPIPGTTYPVDASCNAIPSSSTESPIARCAMLESYPSPTSISENGTSGNADFKTGLAAGAVIGVLSIIVATMLYVFYRRHKQVQEVLNPRSHNVRATRFSMEPRSRITPYDLEMITEANLSRKPGVVPEGGQFLWSSVLGRSDGPQRDPDDSIILPPSYSDVEQEVLLQAPQPVLRKAASALDLSGRRRRRRSRSRSRNSRTDRRATIC